METKREKVEIKFFEEETEKDFIERITDKTVKENIPFWVVQAAKEGDPDSEEIVKRYKKEMETKLRKLLGMSPEMSLDEISEFGKNLKNKEIAAAKRVADAEDELKETKTEKDLFTAVIKWRKRKT